ncbi:TniQ family protein [Bacillus sp. Bva_UNVM-123]|uniref:TniQ family protein n=1 Tax=Bacillus sp. Bva_UNVM-123 TaxID=2829798 RepID=UPI00391EE669
MNCSLVSQEGTPERSVFYSISPVTVEKESLTGYISRLCLYHNIKVSDFFKYALDLTIRASGVEFDNENKVVDPYLINGYGQLNVEIIERIINLTEIQTLPLLTLQPLSQSLKLKFTLKTTKSWCPVCLEEGKKSGLVYEKLIWAFNCINYCPIHDVKLENQCTNCDNYQPVLSPNSIPGYCHHCGMWLGIKDYQIQLLGDRGQITWQSWIYNNINELIHMNDQEQRRLLNHEIVSEVVAKVLRNVMLNNVPIRRFAKDFLKISYNTVYGWIYKKNFPSLENMLNICYCVDLTLIEILSGKTETNRLRELPITKKNKLIKRLQNRHNKPAIKNQLEKILRTYDDVKTVPISLNKITEGLGITQRDYISVNFPDEANIIRKKYKNYVEQQLLINRTNNKNNIIKTVKDLNKKGIYPSRLLVERILKKPGLFRTQYYFETYNQILNELGIEKKPQGK